MRFALFRDIGELVVKFPDNRRNGRPGAGLFIRKEVPVILAVALELWFTNIKLHLLSRNAATSDLLMSRKREQSLPFKYHLPTCSMLKMIQCTDMYLLYNNIRYGATKAP